MKRRTNQELIHDLQSYTDPGSGYLRDLLQEAAERLMETLDPDEEQ